MNRMAIARMLTEFIDVLVTLRDSLQEPDNAHRPTMEEATMEEVWVPLVHEHLYIDGQCACGVRYPGRSY